MKNTVNLVIGCITSTVFGMWIGSVLTKSILHDSKSEVKNNTQNEEES